ncbi:MAG: type I glyceraldehyde-3-phosphate dehydrogenase [Chloroflexi bacterium]|nr:type I glyceraldehyde-3-phosphate dehydrogenase [Chloroflexota bacterium]
MSVKVGINGLGRIGSLVLRSILGVRDLEVVAVNDLTKPDTLAYLFQFNSVHGTYRGHVDSTQSSLIINGKQIRVFAERDPAKIPWRDSGVEIVVESTGRFENQQDASKHLAGGVRKVIITAPAKGVERTLVLGVNEDTYDPGKHDVVAMGSCTTYALAPVAKVLNERFGIVYGFINTAHAYTNTQALLDKPVDGKRRSRAAAVNIVPTTTGAAKAIGLVIPELEGRMDGCAIRVPVPDGSIVDLTCVLNRDVTVEEVNQAFREAAQSERLRKYLTASDKELVSSDIIGTSHSSIVDTTLTMAKGNLVKVFAWYDNEWSFSMRVADLTAYIAKRLPIPAK